MLAHARLWNHWRASHQLAKPGRIVGSRITHQRLLAADAPAQPEPPRSAAREGPDAGASHGRPIRPASPDEAAPRAVWDRRSPGEAVDTRARAAAGRVRRGPRCLLTG